jgi:UDP-N-acetylmuramate dehydrogenase
MKKENMPVPSGLEFNVPLHIKNWFGTGGSARLFGEPTTTHQFQAFLRYAHHNNLPLFLLGEGANILISDAGFDGMVIRPALKNIVHYNLDAEHCLVEAGAGVAFDQLITYCLDNNLGGLEEFSGIPGSVGGSVFINIHYFEFLLDQFIVYADLIHHQTQHIERMDRAWFSFGYNYSTLHKKDYYVASAAFKLKKLSSLETMYARGRRKEIIRHRLKRYPYKGTCGSFFRNFHDHEVAHVRNDKKLIFVGYYLDTLGIKGELAIGDASISHQHANMIVNRGHATSHDIVVLARTMQELVYQRFGILPQPECQLIGFAQYPLLSTQEKIHFQVKEPLCTIQKN